MSATRKGVTYPGFEDGAHRDEVIGGVTIHRCPIIPRKTGPLYRFLNYYSFVHSAGKYLRHLQEDFDVVYVNQLSPVMMAQPALRWAKRHGKKCVLYCLDLWPESLLMGGIQPGSFLYRSFLKISRRIYRQADAILVSSHGFLSYFRDVLGIDPAPIRYMPQYAEELFLDLPPAPPREPGIADLPFLSTLANLFETSFIHFKLEKYVLLLIIFYSLIAISY